MRHLGPIEMQIRIIAYHSTVHQIIFLYGTVRLDKIGPTVVLLDRPRLGHSSPLILIFYCELELLKEFKVLRRLIPNLSYYQLFGRSARIKPVARRY